MTTSRTGTAKHKRMVRIAKQEAQAAGITHCPACGVELDYVNCTAPNGAHADEIIAYQVRGYTSTDPTHWQVLCATCNQRKGNRSWAKTDDRPPFPLSGTW